MATTTASRQNTKQKAKVIAKKTATAAKKGVDKTGDFVKSNPKTALYVVGRLVVGVVLYKVIKSITSGDILKPDIDNQVDVGNLPTTGATITGQKARVFAQQLLDAMNHKQPLWGTDEATILNVFNKLTPADFRMVFNAFGNKDYNGHNSPPEGPWAFLDSYEPKNLVYWLHSELSPRDGEVYRKVKETVIAAGFAF